MKGNINQIGTLLLNSAPLLPEMRGHPEFKDWAKSLVALSQLERLAPLREVLGSIAADALTTSEPFIHFLESQARTVSFYTYLEASITAERKVADSPCAAFILSLVSMFGWSYLLGESLYTNRLYYPKYPYLETFELGDGLGVFYDDLAHMPYDDRNYMGGWDRIPYACALTSLKIGALEGAKQLVEHCYEEFMATTTAARWHPCVVGAVARYRYLAEEIQQVYEWAIRDLADDFRKLGCDPSKQNFRAEIGAMLWSLGWLPESQLFMSTADLSVLPTSRFFKRLVRQALDCVPYDPLIQFIWLEMKDRLPFNIRDHKAFFSKINTVYHQMPFDELIYSVYFHVPPSRLYAQTLIHWFSGDLDEELAFEYCSTVRYLINMPFPQDWHMVRLRMVALANILAKRFGWFPPDLTEKEELQGWYELNGMASQKREEMNLYPGLPEIQSRVNVALFHIIESELLYSADSTSLALVELERILDAIERVRVSTLSYWLKIAPPRPSSSEQTKLGSLLEQEKQLLEYFRGAYFLLQYDSLPRQFDIFSLGLEDYVKVGEDKEKFNLEPAKGREQYKELEEELDILFREMQKVAPDYASKRLNPEVGLENLIKAISNHTCPSEAW